MRRKPYTEIGIRRVPCFRCKVNKSVYQWQICSDDNVFRGICAECDIAMNTLVLRFMRFPDWQEKINAYKEKVKDRV